MHPIWIILGASLLLMKNQPVHSATTITKTEGPGNIVIKDGRKELLVATGSNIALTCTVEGEADSVSTLWNGPTMGISYNDLLLHPDNSKFGITSQRTADDAATEYTIEILDLSEEDSGDYQCQAIFFGRVDEVEVVVSHDTSPPDVACISNVTGTISPTEGNGTTVTWTEPTATDDLEYVTTTQSHQSGSFFNLGTTAVVYIFTDGVENSVSCTFYVNVVLGSEPLSYRLVGGSRPSEGRVEVQVEDSWGSVCASLDSTFADLSNRVCLHLGYSGNVSYMVSPDLFDGEYLPVLLYVGGVCLDGDRLEDCKLNPLDGNSSCDPSNNEYLAVVCKEFLQDVECYTDAAHKNDYRGRVSVTQSGTPCQKWTDQEPHSQNVIEYHWAHNTGYDGFGDHKYCRNPNQADTSAWCYTTNQFIRTEYCNIGSPSDSCAADKEVLQDVECYTDAAHANDYRGQISVTKSGKTCQKWTEQVPHSHNVVEHNRIHNPEYDGFGDHNYCRNPNQGDTSAWCFTTDPSTRVEYCNLGPASDFCPDLDDGSALRLYGGSLPSQGLVEVKFNGTWGLICTEIGPSDLTYFDYGERICRQLGYTNGSSYMVSPLVFELGVDNVWLHIDGCNENETRIQDCQNKPWGNYDCDSEKSSIVAVICNDSTPDPKPIRLIGSSQPSEGRLEIQVNGTWGRVCVDPNEVTQWEERNVEVVCRQLGFSLWSFVTISGKYGEGAGPIWLTDVQCAGTESHLDSCPHNLWGEYNSTELEECLDIGIVCNVPFPVSIGLYGSIASEGLLEIYFHGEVGHVCNNAWNDDNTKVVCRQLGFTDGIAYSIPLDSLGILEYRSRRIWLDEVSCNGDEAYLHDCPHSPWGTEDSQCTSHDNDVAIVCNGEIPKIRLVGGRNSREGRVEINFRGQWGTICAHGSKWSDIEAAVVCRQLGYNTRWSFATSSAVFGRGDGVVWLEDVKCQGTENVLTECSHSPWFASRKCDNNNMDVGVICEEDRSSGVQNNNVPGNDQQTNAQMLEDDDSDEID